MERAFFASFAAVHVLEGYSNYMEMAPSWPSFVRHISYSTSKIQIENSQRTTTISFRPLAYLVKLRQLPKLGYVFCTSSSTHIPTAKWITP